MKSLMVLFIIFVVLVGKITYCIIWVGIEDMTNMAKVTRLAIVKVFVFQLASLPDRVLRRNEKSQCLGERLRSGKPRYFPRSEVLLIDKIFEIWEHKFWGQASEK